MSTLYEIDIEDASNTLHTIARNENPIEIIADALGSIGKTITQLANRVEYQ